MDGISIDDAMSRWNISRREAEDLAKSDNDGDDNMISGTSYRKAQALYERGTRSSGLGLSGRDLRAEFNNFGKEATEKYNNHNAGAGDRVASFSEQSKESMNKTKEKQINTILGRLKSGGSWNLGEFGIVSYAGGDNYALKTENTKENYSREALMREIIDKGIGYNVEILDETTVIYKNE